MNAEKRLEWLQDMHNLHRSVRILYVVIGYEVTVEVDDAQVGPAYFGESLSAAIDAAMAEVRP